MQKLRQVGFNNLISQYTMEKQKQSKQIIHQYLIYDVIIEGDYQTNLFAVQDAVENAQEHFGSLFSGHDFSFSKEVTRNGERTVESLENYILARYNDIYVLRIHNSKDVKLIKQDGSYTNGVPDYEVQPDISYPYCYVVVDNRKAISKMAIQQNSAFQPNTIRKLLEENLNKAFYLANIPLKITISQCTRSSETWEFTRQRESVGDHIKQISFMMTNQKNVNAPQRIKNPTGYVKGLLELMELTNAIQTKILMDYEHTLVDNIEQHAEDLANIVRTFGKEKYQLAILFRKYGWYTFDSQVKAKEDMDEELLLAFPNSPASNKDYNLIDWCDKVSQESELFKVYDTVPAQQHRED